MDKQQLEALYGPSAAYSDHKPGDTITYHSGGQETTDTIMYVIAPTATSSMCYVMTEPDPHNSLPALVYPSQIVNNPEPTLYTCLKCGQMHNTGQSCPLA